MIRNKHDENKICQKHNLPLEFLNPDEQKTNQLYVCNRCIIEYYQLVPIQLINQSNKKLAEQFEEQFTQNSNIWNILIHSLISLREKFNKSIKIIENIIDIIRNQLQQTTNEFQNMIINPMEGIKTAHENYLQNQLHQKTNIIQQMEVLKLNSSIDKLIQSLSEIKLKKLNFDDQTQKNTIVEIQKLQVMDQAAAQNEMKQQRVKRYEFQLIPESSIKQDDICCAISFNYDGSIIVAGCGNIIQVFKFKNKQLKKLQKLQGHKNWVNCLKFMKRNNQFISGSADCTIKIWYKNDQKQWFNIRTLKKHTDWIYCLILNCYDDLIVSGSSDKSIIFWGLKGFEWQVKQQINFLSAVESLSFNDFATKLISCELNKLIQVFEKQEKQWIIFQKIQVATAIMRLCFINNDQFVFLPLLGKYLHLYKFDQQSNQFEQQLQAEAGNSNDDSLGFPIKFIRCKNLLIVKNCEFVNVFRQQGNQNYIQDQQIRFKTSNLHGDISENGDFMVTWDQNTQEYQVSHLKEIQ